MGEITAKTKGILAMRSLVMFTLCLAVGMTASGCGGSTNQSYRSSVEDEAHRMERELREKGYTRFDDGGLITRSMLPPQLQR